MAMPPSTKRSPCETESRSPGRNVALYLNDRFDLEVGVEVGEDVGAEPESEVVRSATPAGEVARSTHFGPY